MKKYIIKNDTGLTRRQLASVKYFKGLRHLLAEYADKITIDMEGLTNDKDKKILAKYVKETMKDSTMKKVNFKGVTNKEDIAPKETPVKIEETCNMSCSKQGTNKTCNMPCRGEETDCYDKEFLMIILLIPILFILAILVFTYITR